MQHDVQVLDSPPEGAEKIGSVQGFEGGTIFATALGEAKSLAADMGADAIVVTGRGEGATGGMIPVTVPVVWADAYRLRR